MGSSGKPRIGPKSMKTMWNKEKARRSSPTATQQTGTLKQLYFVEKIMKKKVEDGVSKYLIKWDGYSNSENTWEPVEHIPVEMVKDFEGEMSIKTKVPLPLGPIKHEHIINTDGNSSMANGYVVRSESGMNYIEEKDQSNEVQTIPFAKNVQNKTLSYIETVTLKPLKSNPNGECRLTFIVRFEGSEQSEAVTSEDAYALFPSKVIEYYESIVSFS